MKSKQQLLDFSLNTKGLFEIREKISQRKFNDAALNDLGVFYFSYRTMIRPLYFRHLINAHDSIVNAFCKDLRKEM